MVVVAGQLPRPEDRRALLLPLVRPQSPSKCNFPSTHSEPDPDMNIDQRKRHTSLTTSGE